MLLPRLVHSEKSIPDGIIQWSAGDPDDGYIKFQTSLEIEGILEAGVVFSGGTYSHLPDRHVTFELAIIGHRGRRLTKLMRLDWRDLKKGHSNKRKRCQGNVKRAPATHLHSFDLNWSELEGRMKRGNLPCAEGISEDLQDFEQLRSFAGRLFRINNIEVVPRPDWVYDLFNDDD